jgi:hypothetical protein
VSLAAALGRSLPHVLSGSKPLDVWFAKPRNQRGAEKSRLYGAMVALKLLDFATSYTVG